MVWQSPSAHNNASPDGSSNGGGGGPQQHHQQQGPGNGNGTGSIGAEYTLQGLQPLFVVTSRRVRIALIRDGPARGDAVLAD